MLSLHYVSIMMRIFYIDWQQHWECDRTMNIGANAHGERTVSTKQPQVTDFSQSDYFTVRPFFCCYICICCLKLHQADYQVEEFVGFFYLDLVGEHSAPMYLLFAPYIDLWATEGISAFQTSLLFSRAWLRDRNNFHDVTMMFCMNMSADKCISIKNLKSWNN